MYTLCMCDCKLMYMRDKTANISGRGGDLEGISNSFSLMPLPWGSSEQLLVVYLYASLSLLGSENELMPLPWGINQ